MSDEWAEALQRGWNAGIDGREPRDCPYQKMTREWNVWQSARTNAVVWMEGVERSRSFDPYGNSDALSGKT